MKRIWLLFLLMLILTVAVHAIPNPALFYCTEMGYAIDDLDCVFDDGTRCTHYDFYEGTCGQEWVKELPCTELGGSNLPGHECCEGLVSIGVAFPSVDGICGQVAGAWPVCAACGDGICAMINPDRYGDWESDCNCQLDCSADSCKPEGYRYWTTPISKDFRCCEGRVISIAEYEGGGLCRVTADWGMCSACDNGNCEDWENVCNCPGDCPLPDCSDTDGGRNQLVKGTVTSDGASLTDECQGQQVKESYCLESGLIATKIIDCPGGCEDGACIEEVDCPQLMPPQGKEGCSYTPRYEDGCVVSYDESCYCPEIIMPSRQGCTYRPVYEGDCVVSYTESCEKQCPDVTPSPAWCRGGEIIPGPLDEDGCHLPPKCRLDPANQMGMMSVREATIERSQEQLVIRSQASVAKTTENLVVEEDTLSVDIGSATVRIMLPDQAATKAMTEQNEIELKVESEKPVYIVRGIRKAKVLFVAVDMDIETTIDASSGETLSVKKPWWSMFAS